MPEFLARIKRETWKRNSGLWWFTLTSMAGGLGKAVSEIGSGLNGQRPKLKRLLANPKVQTIVMEHRDRLMRFGPEYVEPALAAQGRKFVVVERSEVKDDLVQDMIEVLTSFCARLYGRRSAGHWAKKALQTIGQETTL